MSLTTEKLGNLLAPSGHDRGGSKDYPVLSITMHEGLIDQSAKFKKRVASSNTSSYRVVYANELVVGFPIDEGVLGFQTLYPAALVSPAYGVWKLKKPAETHIPFVQGYLRSTEARGIYASKMRGAVARRRSITREDFLEIEIPFPLLDEQKRIAAVLDKADALRRQRQESLQLTEKLLQSVFIDMFGDPTLNPKNWGTVPLEELCDKIVDCPHSTPVYSDVATGFYCVRSSDIQNGKLDLASTRYVSESIFVERIARHEPKAGEVIYTREGGRLGFAAQVPRGQRVCLGQRMMLFKAKEKVSTNAFLANLLNSESFRRKVLNLVGGGAAPRVNIKDLRTMVVFRPPVELQERFEKFTESLLDAEESLAQSEVQTRKLFESLQQRAFRGELDLSRLKLDDEVLTPATTPSREPTTTGESRYERPGVFQAPPEIEAQLVALDKILEFGPGDSIDWSQDYFKYRILGHLLFPYSFAQIWQEVYNAMPEADYDKVKDAVFEYVANGTLVQEFNEARKEIVFQPRP